MLSLDHRPVSVRVTLPLQGKGPGDAPGGRGRRVGIYSCRVPRQKPLTWKTGYAPTWKDRHIESAWLAEHWVYGGRIHEEAAAALAAAFNSPSTRSVGHSLYFKLFAEFANALEVAGAWGWVMRTRREHPLLLDAFLTYPLSAPRDFYLAARRNRSGSLIQLLKLPPEDKVVPALDAAIQDWTAEECRQSLAEAVRQSKFLAGRYFDHNEIIRTAYNRAKHGATMLHDKSLSNREFWVIAPHLEITGPRDTARYDLPKFTVSGQGIRDLQKNIEIAGSLIRYLAGLARALNDAGLLYGKRTRRP